jgi:indole-3-glycerol phosphate synthase
LPSGKGFRARAAAPFSVEAESSEKANVIAEVKRAVDGLMADGQVVFVDVGPSNAAAALIGTLDMNNPEVQKWWRHVEEFRDECDSLTFPGEGE